MCKYCVGVFSTSTNTPIIVPVTSWCFLRTTRHTIFIQWLRIAVILNCLIISNIVIITSFSYSEKGRGQSANRMSRWSRDGAGTTVNTEVALCSLAFRLTFFLKARRHCSGIQTLHCRGLTACVSRALTGSQRRRAGWRRCWCWWCLWLWSWIRWTAGESLRLRWVSLQRFQTSQDLFRIQRNTGTH